MLYTAVSMLNFLKRFFYCSFIFILWMCFTIFLLFSCYALMILLDFAAEFYYRKASAYVLKCALLLNVFYTILFISYLSVRNIHKNNTSSKYTLTIYFMYFAMLVIFAEFIYIFKTKLTHYFYLPYIFNKCNSYPWDALNTRKVWSSDKWEFFMVVLPIFYLILALVFLIILGFFKKQTGVLPFLIKLSYFLMITLSYWHEIIKIVMSFLMILIGFFTKTYFTVDIDGVKSWIIKQDSLSDSDIIGLYSSIFYDAFSTSLVFILLTKLLFSSIFYLMSLRCFNTFMNNWDKRADTFNLLFTVTFFFIMLHALSVYCLYFGVGFLF